MIEIAVALLTTIFRDPLEELVLPKSATPSPRNTKKVTMNFKLQLLPRHSRFLIPAGKKRNCHPGRNNELASSRASRAAITQYG